MLLRGVTYLYFTSECFGVGKKPKNSTLLAAYRNLLRVYIGNLFNISIYT